VFLMTDSIIPDLLVSLSIDAMTVHPVL